jgi:hypothetical protein
MSSQGSVTLLRCAAGIYCKVLLLDITTRIHKCYLCQQAIHGLCDVPHDPDNITYQDLCHLCDFKYFKSNNTNPAASAFHTPTTGLLMAPPACLVKPSSIVI